MVKIYGNQFETEKGTITKDSDWMRIKFLIVVTCHRLFDRTEIVNKLIDDFNNPVHLSMKASKKVVETLID